MNERWKGFMTITDPKKDKNEIKQKFQPKKISTMDSQLKIFQNDISNATNYSANQNFEHFKSNKALPKYNKLKHLSQKMCKDDFNKVQSTQKKIIDITKAKFEGLQSHKELTQLKKQFKQFKIVIYQQIERLQNYVLEFVCLTLTDVKTQAKSDKINYVSEILLKQFEKLNISRQQKVNNTGLQQLAQLQSAKRQSPKKGLTNNQSTYSLYPNSPNSSRLSISSRVNKSMNFDRFNQAMSNLKSNMKDISQLSENQQMKVVVTKKKQLQNPKQQQLFPRNIKMRR